MQATPSNCSEPTPETPTHTDLLRKLEERGYPERHRKHLKVMEGPSLAKAEALWPRVESGDCLIVLVGDRGPGKTQMATYWAYIRLSKNLTAGWYRKTADLISEIKMTWADNGKIAGTEHDLIRKYRTVPFLVLDEFNEKGASDWEARTLNNIIDHRYDAMLSTVIIANLSLDKVKDAISASILSRAEETGGLVNCNWPSYRAK